MGRRANAKAKARKMIMESIASHTSGGKVRFGKHNKKKHGGQRSKFK